MGFDGSGAARPELLRIGRRRLLVAGSALVAAGIGLPAWAAGIATPRQTEGPFYPTTLPLDIDNDLVRIQGVGAQAVGVVTHVAGRVTTLAGQPVGGPGWGVDPSPAARIDGHTGRRETVPGSPGDYPAFYDAVAAALSAGAPNPVPPEQALAVMEVLEAGIESDRRRAEVQIPAYHS